MNVSDRSFNPDRASVAEIRASVAEIRASVAEIRASVAELSLPTPHGRGCGN